MDPRPLAKETSTRASLSLYKNMESKCRASPHLINALLKESLEEENRFLSEMRELNLQPDVAERYIELRTLFANLGLAKSLQVLHGLVDVGTILCHPGKQAEFTAHIKKKAQLLYGVYRMGCSFFKKNEIMLDLPIETVEFLEMKGVAAIATASDVRFFDLANCTLLQTLSIPHVTHICASPEEDYAIAFQLLNSDLYRAIPVRCYGASAFTHNPLAEKSSLGTISHGLAHNNFIARNKIVLKEEENGAGSIFRIDADLLLRKESKLFSPSIQAPSYFSVIPMSLSHQAFAIAYGFQECCNALCDLHSAKVLFYVGNRLVSTQSARVNHPVLGIKGRSQKEGTNEIARGMLTLVGFSDGAPSTVDASSVFRYCPIIQYKEPTRICVTEFRLVINDIKMTSIRCLGTQAHPIGSLNGQGSRGSLYDWSPKMTHPCSSKDIWDKKDEVLAFYDPQNCLVKIICHDRELKTAAAVFSSRVQEGNILCSEQHVATSVNSNPFAGTYDFFRHPKLIISPRATYLGVVMEKITTGIGIYSLWDPFHEADPLRDSFSFYSTPVTLLELGREVYSSSHAPKTTHEAASLPVKCDNRENAPLREGSSSTEGHLQSRDLLMAGITEGLMKSQEKPLLFEDPGKDSDASSEKSTAPRVYSGGSLLSQDELTDLGILFSSFDDDDDR